MNLDDFAVNLEFTVKEINGLLSILNHPISAQTVQLISYIQLIQSQAGPQVDKAQASLKAVEEAQKKDGE